MRSLKRFLAHSYFYLCEFAASLRADQTVAVSHDTCRYYLNVSHVIPNGVAVDRFADCGEARSLHPTILFVGDLDSRKRGRMLLDVFSNQVRPLLPDCELWLVCPERVHAPGVVCHSAVADERLAALYRLTWVFCLPSSYEGFGRPYVEAMAAGAAVVATPNPGAREVLADGLYGMIASPDQLANALHAMLSDTERRKDYVHRGRDRAQSYAWEQVAQQYEQVYESVRMPRA